MSALFHGTCTQGHLVGVWSADGSIWLQGSIRTCYSGIDVSIVKDDEWRVPSGFDGYPEQIRSIHRQDRNEEETHFFSVLAARP